MGYAFRKRDAALVAGILILAAAIFALGFLIGARSGYYENRSTADGTLSSGQSDGIIDPSESDDPDSVLNDDDDAMANGESAPPQNGEGSEESGETDGTESIDTGDGTESPPEEEDEPISNQHFISWQFFTYREPIFGAVRVESLSPRSVEIIERRQDGWALIDTGDSESWAYLNGNMFFLDRWVDLYNDAGSGNTQVGFAPSLVEIIEQSGDWIKISTEHGDRWVDINSIRQSVRLDIEALDQRELGYPLGCEMVALTMLMNYEFDVSVHDLVAEMPRADNPYEGFRGEPSSSSRGWTIFPPALAGLMNRYVGNSYDMSGMQMEDLRAQLNRNLPIMVWVRGLGWAVHALCLTGYDGNGFYYNDPWTGVKDTFITYSDFYAIWNEPIYDSVLVRTYDPRKAMSYFA